MAHKGKATSDVRFNPEDPPEAFTNPSVHSRLSTYSEVGKEKYGPDWDPSAHNLDPEVLVRAGGGRKHGRLLFGDSLVDTASTPSLSQVRASSTSASPAIRQRPQYGVQALQVSSILFLVRSFLHIFASHSDIGMEFCRPSSQKRGREGRRWKRDCSM